MKRFVLRELHGYLLNPHSTRGQTGRKQAPTVAYVMDSIDGYKVISSFKAQSGLGYAEALSQAKSRCAELNAWDRTA